MAEELVGNRSFTVSVEDDETIGAMISLTLGVPNYNFFSWKQFDPDAVQGTPAVVFVDVHLSGDENGLDFIPDIGKHWPDAAIIVITADEDENTLAHALALGAHDFVQKPIRPLELMARVKARLDEVNRRPDLVLRFGDLTFDSRLSLLKGPLGETYLAHKEKELLIELIKSQGITLAKDVLKRRLWGAIKVTDNAFDRKVFEVRKAIKQVSTHTSLQTKYGIGMHLLYAGAAIAHKGDTYVTS